MLGAETAELTIKHIMNCTSEIPSKKGETSPLNLFMALTLISEDAV